MNFTFNTDIFNLTYSNTLATITNEAMELMKTISPEETVFMKEHYEHDGCDDFGPYHHIWTFFLFTRDSHGDIHCRRFCREYNEKSGETSTDNPYEEERFGETDIYWLQRLIEDETMMKTYY